MITITGWTPMPREFRRKDGVWSNVQRDQHTFKKWSWRAAFYNFKMHLIHDYVVVDDGTTDIGRVVPE